MTTQAQAARKPALARRLAVDPDRRTRRLWTLLAFVVYLAYAVFLTWPLALHLDSRISGIAVSGDLGGSVAQLAYAVQHHIFPFAPAAFHDLNAPQGTHQTWVLNVASLPAQTVLYTLGYVFGAIAAHGIYLIGGYVLTAMAMFLLARRLFGSPGAALIAGFAFAFFPWAVDKINGHYDYMFGFVFVPMVWRMFELGNRPTVRNGLLAGCAVAFAMWWTPYFILIAGVSYFALAVAMLVVLHARGEGRLAVRSILASGVPIVLWFIVIGALTVLAGSSATGTVRTTSIQDLYTYSARWLEWFVPDRHNLIFSGVTAPYLTSHLHGSNFSESSLYLGDSVVLLAVGGFALAVRALRRARVSALSDIRVLAALGSVVLAVVAAWVSSPPKVRILGVWVPMPSWVIFHLSSTWRVYTRFVEVVELAVCVLAAYLLAQLVHRRRGIGSGLLVVVLPAVIVLDLWARPPVRTTIVSPAPPEYVWLAHHPGGIVADYPIEPAIFPNYSMLFWQMAHRHPLFQGYPANSEDESAKLDLEDLAEPRTAPDLAALGVRYVVTHPGQPDAAPATMRSRGFTLRFAAPTGDVWQVTAAPARTRVDMLVNFSGVEGGPGYEYRWMVGSGVMGIYASGCATCSGTLTFRASSAIVARHLTVTDQRTGKVLARSLVSPNGRLVLVRIAGIGLHNGWARLSLTTDIPAENPHNGDPRLLSVNVLEPRFALGRS